MPGDKVHQKFTGYQKDNETQLDFAEARMYENRFGRFTAVDPLLASGRSANPQTFNRFVYVSNNPIILSDPTGLDPWWKGNCNKGGTCSYRNVAEKPTDGDWEPVNYNNFGYTTIGNVDGSGMTGYLYATGGMDYGARASEIYDTMQNIMSLDLASDWEACCNPKTIAVRNPALRNATADVIGGITGAGYNAVAGTYNLGASGGNYFGVSLPYMPEYTPPANRPGQKLWYYGTNIGLVFQGGAAGLAKLFATKPNKAVFWSGFPEARTAATSFARATGSKTIEMTTGGRVLNVFSPTLRTMGSSASKLDDILWRSASRPFARQASGNPSVFLRSPINPQSTWRTVEEPILKARGINFQINRVN